MCRMNANTRPEVRAPRISTAFAESAISERAIAASTQIVVRASSFQSRDFLAPWDEAGAAAAASDIAALPYPARTKLPTAIKSSAIIMAPHSESVGTAPPGGGGGPPPGITKV